MSFSGTKGYITKPKPGVMINPLHPLSKGLVGYWLFNEGSGSHVNDISGHNNHATLKNMSPNAHDSGWGGSKLGGGSKFDGVDDYMECPDFNFTPSGTIYIRAKMDLSVAGATLIQEKTLGYIDWDIASSLLRSRMYDTSFKQYAYSITQDTFYDFVVTWNTSEIKWYLDGIKKDSTAFTGLNAGANSVIFGADRLLGGNIECQIDFIYIFNHALSEAEVKQLYYDPFCNLLQVPIRRYSVAAPPAGNSYWYYQMLKRRN